MCRLLVNVFSYSEPLICLFAIFALFRARQIREYANLTLLLCLRLFADLAMICVMFLASHHVLSASGSYNLYFFIYWGSTAGEALLSLYVILAIFRSAMAPLKGLQSLGMFIFRWAAVVSVALALATGFHPSRTGVELIVTVVSQLNQISSIFVLCLLVFVCFAIRPMGLSFKSRQFGVSLGLGTAAAAHLILSAWFQHTNIYSPANTVLCLMGLTAIGVWTVYFMLPEVKPRILMLPTTSPYLQWNQISEALGDEPGFVAIAGVPPDVFASAEIEIMVRASAMMHNPDEVKAEETLAVHSLSA